MTKLAWRHDDLMHWFKENLALWRSWHRAFVLQRGRDLAAAEEQSPALRLKKLQAEYSWYDPGRVFSYEEPKLPPAGSYDAYADAATWKIRILRLLRAEANMPTMHRDMLIKPPSIRMDQEYNPCMDLAFIKRSMDAMAACYKENTKDDAAIKHGMETMAALHTINTMDVAQLQRFVAHYEENPMRMCSLLTEFADHDEDHQHLEMMMPHSGMRNDCYFMFL